MELSLKLNRDVRLNDGQRQAMAFAEIFPSWILTGGPGCGKTLTIQAVAGQSSGSGLRMAAPTGNTAY
jgi:exodeoxyribonuclease V alpha subunit